MENESLSPRSSSQPPLGSAEPTATEVPVSERPTETLGLDLQHSRRVAAPRAWLQLALPIAGLLLVPLVGLLYAFFGSAPGTESEASASTEAAPKGKKARKGATGKPRSDGAAQCCSKLVSLGKTAPLDQRAAFLSAAQACESAPDEEQALKRARSNLGTSKAEIPNECEE